jgi:hypothetical protein
MLARDQKPLSMMASDTSSYSRSGTPMSKAKFIGDSLDGNARKTTIIPGKGIQTFQTAGEFKLEAIGEPNREFE